MSSEYDFLDDFFSEGVIQASPPPSVISDTKSEDSYTSPSLNSDQVDRLKRENLKLRSRIKLYNKALDQQKSRLTQLLTEKLALREEQRKYADYGKKLEEANLYVEATVQLNKQLQELSKSHEIEKNGWEEKKTKLQESMKDLKKTLADFRRKEDVIKKRRRKYLQALIELSEELMKLESFPKKYKRLYASWKKQLENFEDDDCSLDDDISENFAESPDKTSVSVGFLSPKLRTPKKLAHVSHAVSTLSVMSDSEITEDEATASPVKAKSIHPLRNTHLKKLVVSSDSFPSDIFTLQENRVEKEIDGKDTGKGLNPVLKNLNQNANVKANAKEAKVKGGVTSSKQKKSIHSVDQESSVENDECDLGEERGSNNSSVTDVLEAKSLEIEKSLMALEVTEEKSDQQKSSDSASVQCIMDEMIVRLDVLQPFEDPKTSDRKPEEESACHQRVSSSRVNVCNVTTHVGATEIAGNLSDTDNDDSISMDDWGILPSVEEEKDIEVPTRRKEVTQEKFLVGSKPGNHISETVNNVLSINCRSEISSDSVSNNISSIRTSGEFSDKSSNPKIAVHEGEVHENEVGKEASGACELRTEAALPCDNGRILESNVNPTYSDLDHFPDSGFNSPESPVAEIGEPHVLFEKDHCLNSCVTGSLRDLVSLKDSNISLEGTFKYPYSSEVVVNIAVEVPKISPEALRKQISKNNCKEKLKSPCGQKAKKSPEKVKSSLSHEACTVNDNERSVSMVRRSRRLMKEAEESVSSIIKTRAQSLTRMSPKDNRTKKVTSSPNSNIVKNNVMEVSGSRKGRTSVEKLDLLESSFNILESDEVTARESRVQKHDASLKEGEECSVLQEESNSESDKETLVSCSVSAAEMVETTPNANAKSEVAQTVEKIDMHEVNDDAISSFGDNRSSVMDMAENSDKMSECGENSSSKSDDMTYLTEDDDNDVDLQKSFKKNDLTSDGEPKSTNSEMNEHLDSGANVDIHTNSACVAESSHPQVLDITEKEVNSGEMLEIFSKRSDAVGESLNARKQLDYQMEGVKTSRVTSSCIPSFSEFNIECSTPISKYSDIPKDLKQAFKLFLDVVNPQMVSNTPTDNDASLIDIEMSSKKEDHSRNSSNSIEETNSVERSKDLEMFDEVNGKLDSSFHYPFSVQHLSFLKKPFKSPLDFLVKEKPNPKSNILVRCNYKNSNTGVSDTKTIDSSIMLEDESMLSESSNMHNSSTPCQFTVQNSPAKCQEKVAQKRKRSPNSAGKRKMNFNVIRRPIVPFFFGSYSLSNFFKVKFWIGGHFSMESFVDAYSFPKTSVVCFGHGDLKGLTPSKTENSSSKSAPKFSGVKYSRKGTLASSSYVDKYSSPTKPLLSLFSKKPNFSAFVAADTHSSSAEIHGRKIKINDKSKIKNSSQAEDKVPQESEMCIKSGSNRNANAYAAAVENVICDANGHGNLKRSEKTKSPTNLISSAVRENTNCDKNRNGNLDRRDVSSPAANVVLSAVVDGLSSSKSHAVNSVSDIQEKTVELAETEEEFSLFESQSDGKENTNFQKESPVMNSCSSYSNTSPMLISSSVINGASKEVDGEESHRSNNVPTVLSNPKRTEVVRNDSIDINLSSEFSKGCKPKVLEISRKVEDQRFSPSRARNHSLPRIIQRKSSVTSINRNKSCVIPASRVLENSKALRSCINPASLDTSAVPVDDRVDLNVILSKEESLLSKRKLQDILESNGEPLGKKIIRETLEDGDTFQEMVSSTSDFGTQSESDNGELMIELGPESDDFLISEMGPQEENELLSEVGSSLCVDALLESGFLLPDVGKQSANEAIVSPPKILKRQKLSDVGDKLDTEPLHPSRNKKGNIPMKENTQLEGSETKAVTEPEVYENPPKKRRIAHSPNGNPEIKSSDSTSSKGDYPVKGQPVSESTSLNLTDSNSVSVILVNNSMLNVGEPEELLGKMFGSPEIHVFNKSCRKPRKQTFDRIRKGANLKYSPPPQEVYRMLFGDIEDDDDKLPEVDDSMTFKDPDNLFGDLNDSVDKLYEKTKKIRIAHTPKAKPTVEKEIQSVPQESCKIEESNISKPFSRKSIISSNNFNQKPKVKQSKLEKLRSQIAKARGLFGRVVVDPKLPTTSNAKDDQVIKCKMTTNEDTLGEKCINSAEDKKNRIKSADNLDDDKLETRVREKGLSGDLNNHKPQKDQVLTNEASSNEECNESEIAKRKKGKNVLSDKGNEEVTSEEELSPKSKEDVITRDRSVEDKSRKDGKQIKRKKSSVTVNDSDQESISERDLNSSVKEQEFVSPKRGLKKKITDEGREKATRFSERHNKISPRKNASKKIFQGKKENVSTVIPDSESLTESDLDSGGDIQLAQGDCGTSTKSSRNVQDINSPRKGVTKITAQDSKRKSSLEIADSDSPERSDLDPGKGRKMTLQPVSSDMPSNTVNLVSAKDTGARKSSFLENFALEKDEVGEKSSVLPANSSEESKLNTVQEGNEKEPSIKTIEGGSSTCKDGIIDKRDKENRPTEEILESMEVPPLSPLSSDELVDSFILCCDGDNDNWSPMKPSNKEGDSSKLPESLATSKTIIPETSSTEESRKPFEVPPVELEPQERVQDFFFNIVKKYRGKKYYEINKKDSNPGDKEALKHLLGILNKKQYGTEDMDNLIKELNDETKNFQSKSVAKYLVRILRKEDEDDVQHPAVSGAPRLSEMQLRVLTLVLALDRRCPRFSDLIDIILKGISFLLFRLGHAPEVEVIMPLARIYTTFCKIRKDLQTARTLCYDALYCLGLKAYALIFIVLSVWPEVFRKQNNGRDAEAIESSILIALLELKILKKKGEIKVVPVQNILKNAYKCDQSITSDNFIKKLMLEMRGGKVVEGSQAATILLCKKKGWDWTHGNLLCQNLVSILEDYERGNISVNAAAAAVKLIGFISRSCSMETAGPVKPIVDYLYEAMNNQEKYPMEIQEAIVQSLICLSRFYVHRVAHALDNWTPPTTPSEELAKKMIRLAGNTHKGFWGRHFGQWRKRPKMPKDAVVPFTAGVYYTDADVSKILENSGEGTMESEEGGDLEEEFEEDKEGNEGAVKRMNGLKVRGGKAGHCIGGVRHRGGWIGSRARAVQRNARWVGMLQKESSWIKAEEKKWDEVAWVKKASIPSAERREAESLLKYEGNIFN